MFKIEYTLNSPESPRPEKNSQTFSTEAERMAFLKGMQESAGSATLQEYNMIEPDKLRDEVLVRLTEDQSEHIQTTAEEKSIFFDVYIKELIDVGVVQDKIKEEEGSLVVTGTIELYPHIDAVLRNFDANNIKELDLEDPDTVNDLKVAIKEAVRRNEFHSVKEFSATAVKPEGDDKISLE